VIPILSGVWRLDCGASATITPVSLRELPPDTNALAGMPAVGAPDMFTHLTWETTARGVVVRIPVGDDAEMVVAVRKAHDDATFEATMRETLGLTW